MGKMARLTLALAALTLAGCVHREIEILSLPPGARVTFDGRLLQQPTPVRFPFTWYGHHEIVLEKKGYHRERLLVLVKPPWYEQFPIDFFAENLWPGWVNDVRTYPFVLEKVVPMKEVADDEKAAMKTGLIERAERFRAAVRQELGVEPQKKTSP